MSQTPWEQAYPALCPPWALLLVSQVLTMPYLNLSHDSMGYPQNPQRTICPSPVWG